MQTDFHFYCIGVLARAAGFNIKDSLIIAYNSNYVDDATEGEPLRLTIEEDNSEFSFEPIRTAYDPFKPKQGLEAIGWSAQKRVYIPFHFIPSQQFNAKKPALPYSFVTQPGSKFINYILRQAARESHYQRRLCRIGVALHTYADSWAHQGFTGRENSNENDVEKLLLRDSVTGKYESLVIENIIDDLPFIDVVPEIGHAEALYVPDVPYLDWKCEIGSAREGGGNNVDRYLEAAQHIHAHLRNVKKEGPIDKIPLNGKSVEYMDWGDLLPLIHSRISDCPLHGKGFLWRTMALLLMLNPEERCNRWKNQFIAWFRHDDKDFPLNYDYDPEIFRNDALIGDTAWDNYKPDDWEKVGVYKIAKKSFQQFWDTPWVHFHRAALHQRHLVLSNIMS